MAMDMSCGICIGSCPPLAISFDDKPPETGWALVHPEFRAGAEVSYVCERHLPQGTPDVSGIMIPVTCVGMIHPDEVEAVLSAGASRVRLIGCPPDDCANREGNEWAQARLTGQRRPKAHQRLDLDQVEFDWRAPGDPRPVNVPMKFREVVPPPQWKRLLPVAMTIGALVVGQLLLTFVPVDVFGDDSAVVEVSMKHRVGAAIEGSPAPEGAFGGNGTRLEVFIDGAVALDRSYGGSAVTVFEQVEVRPGLHEVLVVVDDGGVRQIGVFEDSRFIEEREIISITITDALGDANPERGEDLFKAAAIRGGAGCRVCHSLREGDDGVGPSLAGIGTRAAERIPGGSAEEYLQQSILDPDQYIVEGFPLGQMRADAGEGLTDIELADLVAYLPTLR